MQSLVESNYQRYMILVKVWIPIYNSKSKYLNPVFKETSQVKTRIGQKRVGSRQLKPPINQLIAQSTEH